jgi:hypothetical protein
MRLEEHGPAQLRLNRQDGRIEALEMAGLEDAAVLFREYDQFVSLGSGGGKRLFDEQIQTRAKQRIRRRLMVHCGHRHGSGIDMQIRGEHFINGSEDRNGKFGRGIGRSGAIRFNSGDQGHAFPGRFKFAIDTKVIAAECSGTDNGYA